MPAAPELVTVTSRLPSAAPGAMVKVAVIWVAEPTEMLLTATPGPLTVTEAPAAKPVPWIVTGTAVPAVALLGVSEVMLTADTTVNAPDRVAVPPPGFVTVTARDPVAVPAAIVRVAVM